MALPTSPNLTNTGTKSVVYAPSADKSVTMNGPSSGIVNINNQVSQASGAPGSNLNYAANGQPQTSSGAGANTGTNSNGSSGDGLSNAIGTALGLLGAASAAIGAVKALGSGLSNVMNTIRDAQNKAKDIVSAKRVANIMDDVAQSFSSTQVVASNGNDWRVRLGANTMGLSIFSDSIFDPVKATNGVIFPYIPTVSINYRANYQDTQVTHANYSVLGYKNSVVEDITLTCEFTVQNTSDALYWIGASQFFKTATKMFYGNSTPQGNPPLVCQLTGFGNMILNQPTVVIKNFHVELPADVNYINVVAGGQPQWVPTVSTFNVTVAPIYNRERMRKFNLANYARGSELGVM
jgi:hypothetical protein